MDLALERVHGPDGERGLTSTEAALLRYLAERPGQPVSRDELLQQVWGYRPGVVSRAVDKTMARLRSKVERDTATPTHLLRVQGQGYRFEPLQTRAGAGLIGRDALLTRVLELVGRAPVVTLVGPGGVGKTTLARAVARARPGAVVCRLAAVTDAQGIAAALAQALGTDALVAGLQGASLVVLDNAEQIAEPLGDCVERWLEADVTGLLITSRRPLGVAGEQVVQVPPLTQAHAVALFQRAAQRVDPELVLDPERVRPVVVELDQLPLALELAAGRLDTLGVDELSAQLAHSLTWSRRGRGPDRHASLADTLQWSWGLLDPADQAALAALSVFQDGAPRAGVRAVVPDADGALRRLQDASLVHRSRPEGPNGPPRFHLHRSVQRFAAPHCPPGTAARAADWVCGLGLRLREDIHRPHGDRALRALRRERANLVAAVAHRPCDAVHALQPILRMHGPQSQWVALCERALVAARDEPTRHRAALDLGLAALLAGAPRDGLLEGCLRASDPGLRARAGIVLAFVAGLQGDADRASILLADAHALATDHGLPRLQALVWSDRGISAWRNGDWQGALDALARADRLLADHGDDLQRASTALNRANVLHVLDRPDTADQFELARRLAVPFESRRVEAVAALGLADCAEAADDWSEAARWLQHATVLARGLGSPELVAVAALRRAVVEGRREGRRDPSAVRAAVAALEPGGQSAEARWLGHALVAWACGESVPAPPDRPGADAPDVRRLRRLVG